MAKNRKFNVAGSTIYTAKVNAGDVVHFVLEPHNPVDKNAIRIINPHDETIGYVPKASAVEFQEFRTGKYPFYCAKVKEVWRVKCQMFLRYWHISLNLRKSYLTNLKNGW